MQDKNSMHAPSVSAGVTYTDAKKTRAKASFDLEEIKKDIQEIQYRRLERDAEIEEICRLDSEENDPPFVKGMAEITTTMPSARNAEETANSTRYWLCCCKKYCEII